MLRNWIDKRLPRSIALNYNPRFQFSCWLGCNQTLSQMVFLYTNPKCSLLCVDNLKTALFWNYFHQIWKMFSFISIWKGFLWHNWNLRMTGLCSRVWEAKKNSKRECVASANIIIKVQLSNFRQLTILNFTQLKNKLTKTFSSNKIYPSVFIPTTNHPKFVIQCCRTWLINFGIQNCW